MTNPPDNELPPRLPETIAELDRARALLGECARLGDKLRPEVAEELEQLVGTLPSKQLAQNWKRNLRAYREELLGELSEGDQRAVARLDAKTRLAELAQHDQRKKGQQTLEECFAEYEQHKTATEPELKISAKTGAKLNPVNDLSPMDCPFCGHVPHVSEKRDCVACGNAKCPAQPVVTGRPPATAVERWNCRA